MHTVPPILLALQVQECVKVIGSFAPGVDSIFADVDLRLTEKCDRSVSAKLSFSETKMGPDRVLTVLEEA